MHTWSQCYLADLGAEEQECSRARSHRDNCVGNGPNVVMSHKEGEFTANIMTNKQYLCGLVQHELVGVRRYCAPCHFY